MTIEEAIWYLTPIQESASLERYKEALGLAISALRAKQELESNLKELESNKPLALKEMLNKSAKKQCMESSRNGKTDIICGACGWIEMDMDKQPSADVAPVRHERWDGNGRCTGCGGHAPFFAMSSDYYRSPYCFECGAKMDGGETNV